jgi:4-aminobutyrate aminotransferase/(S)-3-amino-2-methylpropionate transaminase
MQQELGTLSNEQLDKLKTQCFSQGVGCISPKFIASAQGAVLRDVEGQEFIDFAGGIGAMNIGHSQPKVVEAIKTQAEKMTHCCLMINPYPPAVALGEKLCQITPGKFAKKVALFNCGAEAVENAVNKGSLYSLFLRIVPCSVIHPVLRYEVGNRELLFTATLKHGIKYCLKCCL